MELAAFLPASIAVDHYVGTGHAIPAGEDTRQFRFERQRIGMERSPFCGRQAQPFSQSVHIGDLADGDHDSVAGNHELRTGNRLGSWPATGVGPTELHLQALEAGPRARQRPHWNDLGAARNINLMPSRSASSISRWSAGISCARAPVDDRYLRPLRNEAQCAQRRERSFRHQSPARGWPGAIGPSRFTRRRNSTPPVTPGRCSPGMPSFRST